MKKKETMEPKEERSQKRNDNYSAGLKNDHFRIFKYTLKYPENHVIILIDLTKHLRKM